MKYQIIYCSVSSTPMQRDDLEDLLEQAQANNARGAITGALVYVNGFFLQILEGDQEALERLMKLIARDLRHERVKVLQEGEITTPTFADWRMAYVSATPEQVARWAGFSSSTRVPEVWEQVGQDRTRLTQLTNGILSALVPGQAS
jgi:Sensors of blue-light using FAD